MPCSLSCVSHVVLQDDAVSSTTPTKEIKEKSISDFIADYKPRKHLLLKPLDKWYNLAVSV